MEICHFALSLIKSSEGPNSFIELTSMTVNLNQYRRTFGVFNNRKIPLKRTHGPSLQKNILTTHLIQTVMILIVLTVRYVISLSSAQNIRLLRRLLFYSFYFINAVSCIHHMWFYSLAIKCSGDIEENPGPKPNSCLFVYLSLEPKQHLCTQLYQIDSSSCLHFR